MTAAIRARGVIAVHDGAGGPVAALRGLDLEVETGEIAVVVGPSGSGKTTLLRILAGAERPTAGSVEVFGTSLDRADAATIRRHRRETVAVVDQHYRRALSPYLPAREVVALPLAVRGVSRAVRTARAAELLEAVGLGDRGAARPAELSGGEQQRLAVAAALAIRPRLLLADEPTGELDAVATGRLLASIHELVHAAGVTTLIVTHDAAVEAISDRVVVLQDGRAVAVRVGPAGTDEQPLVDGAGWRAPSRTWRHDTPVLSPGSLAAPPTDRLAPDAAPLGGPGAEGSTDTVAVALESISRRYDGGPRGIVAIDDLSAAFPSGGVHVVTGPSGSGKSTLLRLVAGLDRPDEGRVVVLGTDLGGLGREELASLRAAHVGVAEQARGLVPFLDVRENVALALAIRASSTDGVSAAAMVDAILRRLGIGHLGGRLPSELSAGERTRVAIARALVAGPGLLLLDEPTATLDRVSARVVADLLAELGRELTVVVATHDPALVAVASGRLDLRRPAAGWGSV